MDRDHLLAQPGKQEPSKTCPIRQVLRGFLSVRRTSPTRLSYTEQGDHSSTGSSETNLIIINPNNNNTIPLRTEGTIIMLNSLMRVIGPREKEELSAICMNITCITPAC